MFDTAEVVAATKNYALSSLEKARANQQLETARDERVRKLKETYLSLFTDEVKELLAASDKQIVIFDDNSIIRRVRTHVDRCGLQNYDLELYRGTSEETRLIRVLEYLDSWKVTPEIFTKKFEEGLSWIIAFQPA